MHYPASQLPCKDSPAKAPSGCDGPLQDDQHGHGSDNAAGGELQAPEVPPSQEKTTKEVAELQAEQPALEPTAEPGVDLMEIQASYIENNT